MTHEFVDRTGMGEHAALVAAGPARHGSWMARNPTAIEKALEIEKTVNIFDDKKLAISVP